MLRTTNEIINYTKNSWVLLLLVFLFFYFSYHSISGDRGLIKMLYLKNQIAEAQASSNSYIKEKTKLEGQVKRLSSSSLDLDLLDERARTILNFVAKDEFIILEQDN